jgi:hypothetical protein
VARTKEAIVAGLQKDRDYGTTGPTEGLGPIEMCGQKAIVDSNVLFLELFNILEDQMSQVQL